MLLTADPAAGAPLLERREAVQTALADAGLTLTGWDIGGGAKRERRETTSTSGALTSADDDEQGSPERALRGVFL